MQTKIRIYKLISVFLSFLLIFTSIPWQTIHVSAEETGSAPNVQSKVNDETQSTDIKEIPSLRTEKAKVFQNKDGSYVSEVFLDPIHYKENGKWEDINNTLEENFQGEYENRANNFKVKFPKIPKNK
ncbi:hypothetical protein D1B31_18220 [Neobacillus notoginsengisoli]|uniref:Uncharacterized protein n=2 Tax=Neobacillus notoginsengisoli TaxID=1578198 RepID=A0A417YQG0_9BACI|nr:hypothetical protein D1B31_18220 [Neobacillus notoginsengisoli]